MEKLKTIAVNIVVITILAIILIWGNTLYRQWRQFNKGTQAEAAGDAIGAIAGFETAIHMYTPFSPFVGEAAGKLWALAEKLEKEGDTSKALIAYRSLRSSFYAVQGLNHPGTDWIGRCDVKIAELVKSRKPSAP